jgi:hypothetical protein
MARVTYRVEHGDSLGAGDDSKRSRQAPADSRIDVF